MPKGKEGVVSAAELVELQNDLDVKEEVRAFYEANQNPLEKEAPILSGQENRVSAMELMALALTYKNTQKKKKK